MLCGQCVLVPAWTSFHGSFPRLHRHRRPRRNGRQDPTALAACWPRAFASPGRSCWASSSPPWPTTRWRARLGPGSPQCSGPQVLRWVLGGSFIAMAVVDADPRQARRRRGAARRRAWACSAPRVIAFFLAEMGDKTQVATVMLARAIQAPVLAVVAGTTLGMMLANAPVVWFGERIMRRLPIAPGAPRLGRDLRWSWASRRWPAGA